MGELKSFDDTFKLIGWMKKQRRYAEIYYLGDIVLNAAQVKQLLETIRKQRREYGMGTIDVLVSDNDLVFGLSKDEGTVFIPSGSVNGIRTGSYKLLIRYICYLPLGK